MNTNLIRSIVVAFFIAFPAWSTPTSKELWDNLTLVHLTNILADFTVKPGSANIFSTGLEGQEDEILAAKDRLAFQVDPSKDGLMFIDINRLLAEVRVTTHWSVYDPVDDAAGVNVPKNGEYVAQWSDRMIGIIEPVKYFKGQLFGGFEQDMIVVGPHQLSKEATIFAPKELEAKIREANEGFEGRYWIYDTAEHKNAREAIRDWNQRKKRVYPDSWAIERPRSAYEANLQELASSAANLLSLNGKAFVDVETRAIMGYVYALQKECPKALLAYDPSDDKGGCNLPLSDPTLSISSVTGARNKLREALYVNETDPYTSFVYFNGGKAVRALDFFGAWNQLQTQRLEAKQSTGNAPQKPMFWGRHKSTPFSAFEKAARKLFDRYNINLIERHLQSRGLFLGKPLAKFDLSFTETADATLEFNRSLAKVEAEVAQMSKETQAFFAQYKKNLFEVHLTALAKFMLDR